MDPKTIQYYDAHPDDAAFRGRAVGSGIERHFATSFSGGGRILDVGAGLGRNVLLLREQGCDAFGVEPSIERRNRAIAKNPALKTLLTADSLPSLETIEDECCDGVLCSAVLMHLPERSLFDAAFSLRRVLTQLPQLHLDFGLFRLNPTRPSEA